MAENTGRTREDLTLLGASAAANSYPTDYDPTLLETFENKHQDRDYMVTLNCPEFTTLCTIVINYIPDKRMVESKSLKLYLFSFRNHGDFHEDVTNIILNDLVELMRPRYIEVRGLFNPRGGISIHPVVTWAHPDFGYADIAAKRLFADE